MSRKASDPYIIANKFVTEHLKREWNPVYDKIAMAHAKSLLKDFALDDILGCLDAIRDGLIEPGIPLQSLAGLRKYNPPLMMQWETYKKVPPPVYMKSQYAEWYRRTHVEAPVKEEPPEQLELYSLPE